MTTARRIMAVLVILGAVTLGTSQVAGQFNRDNGTVTAMIDGVAWEADQVSTALYDREFLEFSVGGAQTADETTLTIDVEDVRGPGTFELKGGGSGASFYRFRAGEEFETTDSRVGTLRITSMTDRRATGTFSFDAELRSQPGRVVQVRDGEFDIRLFD